MLSPTSVVAVEDDRKICVRVYVVWLQATVETDEMQLYRKKG